MNISNEPNVARSSAGPQPVISVLVSVYNCKRYLEEALTSITAQTFGRFECIVVDDGSTDGSTAILHNMAARDARIKVIRRENGGLATALNLAASKATGTFLARMDADDVAMPDRFERQVAWLESRPEVVALGTAAFRIDPDGEVIGEIRPATEHEQIEQTLLGFRRTGGYLLHPSVVMRRWAFEAVGGYRVKAGQSEDRDLWLRLAEVGRLANLPDLLIQYRVHPASASHTKRDRQRRYAAQAVREARVRRGLNPNEEILLNLGDAPQDAASLRYCWARGAIGVGNFRAARRHAWAAFCGSPWRIRTLKTLIRAWLGYNRIVELVKLWRRRNPPAGVVKRRAFRRSSRVKSLAVVSAKPMNVRWVERL